MRVKNDDNKDKSQENSSEREIERGDTLSKFYASSSAECPFYKGETDHHIICEGVVDHSSVRLAFGSTRAHKKYLQHFCYSMRRCEMCLIKSALAKKYEE